MAWFSVDTVRFGTQVLAVAWKVFPHACVAFARKPGSLLNKGVSALITNVLVMFFKVTLELPA